MQITTLPSPSSASSAVGFILWFKYCFLFVIKVKIFLSPERLQRDWFTCVLLYIKMEFPVTCNIHFCFLYNSFSVLRHLEDFFKKTGNLSLQIKIAIKFILYHSSPILKEEHFYRVLFLFIIHHKKNNKWSRNPKLGLLSCYSHRLSRFGCVQRPEYLLSVT